MYNSENWDKQIYKNGEGLLSSNYLIQNNILGTVSADLLQQYWLTQTGILLLSKDTVDGSPPP
jgi:hypothetical protein